MRKISIEAFMFMEAFERDVDFESYSQSTYLDLETGKIIWVFDEDDDAEMWAGIPADENSALRGQVEAEPERYLEVRGRDHGEHHDILREFLNSNWTDDEALCTQAYDAYSGSIGGWKESVGSQDAVDSYYEFREQKIKDLAEVFLNDHDIQPIWR